MLQQHWFLNAGKAFTAENLPEELVCRTAAVEVYRSLRIEGKENKLSFQTVGLDEAITYTILAEGVEDFCVIVNFDETPYDDEADYVIRESAAEVLPALLPDACYSAPFSAIRRYFS